MPNVTILMKPVSGACNMRCEYCFYADVAQNRAQASFGRMNLQTLENAIRRTMQYADGAVTFAFQGGEPTLAGIEFYRHVVELQKQYNTREVRICNAIQTNGYQLDDALLELFAREHFLVGISLDGLPALHNRLRKDQSGQGTSQAVERNLRRLLDAGVACNILCVVNQYVAEQPQAVFHYLSRFSYVQFIPCLDPLDGASAEYSLKPESYATFLMETFDLYEQAFLHGRSVSVRNFDNYLRILDGRQPENCAMSGRCAQYYVIEADGGVYPCDFYVLDRWHIGNINQDSFFKLQKSPVAEQFRNQSLQVAAACKSCQWLPLCRGGCRRDREPFVNGLPTLNRWCHSYQAFFSYAYPRMAKMADRLFL